MSIPLHYRYFDPEVKGQCHMEAILVRDTSSQSNTPTCQISLT